MRDMRSTEIKKILKKKYPNAQFKIRIDKYSMGEAIYVRTDLIKVNVIENPNGQGYIREISEETKKNREAIIKLIGHYESIYRDENGEILSGGNTYLFIKALEY